MPDDWEQTYGFNPNSAADAAQDADAILFEIGRIDRVLDEDDAKIDPADRSRIKRRVTALFKEADGLMEWLSTSRLEEMNPWFR